MSAHLQARQRKLDGCRSAGAGSGDLLATLFRRSRIALQIQLDGRIVRGGNARVWRSSKVIATDRIESLRRFRDDVREVQANYECGIQLAGFHDIQEGDIIECFTSQTVSRVSAN